MKNVVIFAGGTGSVALQNGFEKLFGNSINIHIIISAYDNGKSTGECRKVYNGKILGPSDLRKNQLNQFKLKKNIDKKTGLNEDVILYNLFNERFTRVNWEDSYLYAVKRTKDSFKQIRELGFGSELYDTKERILLSLIENFFYDEYSGLNKSVRKTIQTADLADFSISNMYYSAAAALNGNSLALAGKLMADILGIPNNVHLISDVNLYLYAETKKGSIISDEGVIVTYNNSTDPISKVLLLDERGKQYTPSIDEDNQTDHSCAKLIEQADIIIFSCGTQWSSLIPTYIHKGFCENINSSKAKKYLIMNNFPDRDMKGIDATSLLNIVSQYIDIRDVKVVLNSNAEKSMATVKGQWINNTMTSDLSQKNRKVHDPYKLVKLIMCDYYKEYLNSSYYFFDFDDTIWSSSKDPIMRKISKNNLELIYRNFADKCIIISGNSVSHFANLESNFLEAQKKASADSAHIAIYCNGGNCFYEMCNGSLCYIDNIKDSYNLNDDYNILVEKILVSLKEKGWNLSLANFENRGNCILSIKPLANRKKAKSTIDEAIKELFPLENGGVKYSSYINGNTTIDIMNSVYNKSVCAQFIAKERCLASEQIVYVGDKVDQGNDSCIVKLGYTILKVEDVIDFNVFAKTYMLYKS